jgi:hypothetical protein
MTSIADLISKGLVAPGQVISFSRRALRIKHLAHIQSDGKILTEDGKLHNSPSGAAKHFTKKPIDGWNAWKIESTNVSLADLRAQLAE